HVAAKPAHLLFQPRRRPPEPLHHIRVQAHREIKRECPFHPRHPRHHIFSVTGTGHQRRRRPSRALESASGIRHLALGMRDRGPRTQDPAPRTYLPRSIPVFSLTGLNTSSTTVSSIASAAWGRFEGRWITSPAPTTASRGVSPPSVNFKRPLSTQQNCSFSCACIGTEHPWRSVTCEIIARSPMTRRRSSSGMGRSQGRSVHLDTED